MMEEEPSRISYHRCAASASRKRTEAGEHAGTLPSSSSNMPRVVPDQRSKFDNEEFFRKLSRECEIKYTGFRDRPHEERQARFQNACRDGRSEVVSKPSLTPTYLQTDDLNPEIEPYLQTTITQS
ncbi:hypothetical protein NHX12_002835 [Muraenolepis orangiensis]|uniref:Uncharacterized protein n=1 Tax=Muraenolepis orangiensis TaxID=630683 RepID=A0A9Q0IFU3_9TELE|nr:hypothetical protein NHX12_002835 [Muraenolepis orangiensis]